MRALNAGVAIAILSSACDGGSTSPDGGADARQTVLEMPAVPTRDLDLLFVLDDSVGMIEVQQRLALGFSALVESLQALPEGMPNLHLGVVTTDMGTKTSGSATPAPPIGVLGNGGCSGTGKGGALQTFGAQLPDRFLKDLAGAGSTRTRNYTGTLADTFRQMALAGAGGCGFEQPFAAMRAALDNHPMNAGFLRAGAALGVVFVGDEDDCSAKSTALFSPDSAMLGALQSFRCTRFGVTCAVGGETADAMSQAGLKTQCRSSASSTLIDEVRPYRDFLVGLKGTDRRVVLAGITGPEEPVQVALQPPPGGGAQIPGLTPACMFQGQTGAEPAHPGVRLRELIDEFPLSHPTTICQQDFGLAQLAAPILSALGDGCLAQPIADADPSRPGLQPDCIVEDVVGGVATAMESCNASAGGLPCWSLSPSPGICRSGFQSLRLAVGRAVAPDPATVTRLRCTVAP